MSWLGIITSIMTAAFPRRALSGAPVPLNLLNARVGYINEGREGRVVFSKGLRSFQMYYGFGGGDVVAIIEVPSEAEWVRQTGFPLEQRAAILDFIGNKVVHDQTTSGRGRFEVRKDCIEIYSGVRTGRASTEDSPT